MGVAISPSSLVSVGLGEHGSMAFASWCVWWNAICEFYTSEIVAYLLCPIVRFALICVYV